MLPLLLLFVLDIEGNIYCLGAKPGSRVGLYNRYKLQKPVPHYTNFLVPFLLRYYVGRHLYYLLSIYQSSYIASVPENVIVYVCESHRCPRDLVLNHLVHLGVFNVLVEHGFNYIPPHYNPNLNAHPLQYNLLQYIPHISTVPKPIYIQRVNRFRWLTRCGGASLG